MHGVVYHSQTRRHIMIRDHFVKQTISREIINQNVYTERFTKPRLSMSQHTCFVYLPDMRKYLKGTHMLLYLNGLEF